MYRQNKLNGSGGQRVIGIPTNMRSILTFILDVDALCEITERRLKQLTCKVFACLPEGYPLQYTRMGITFELSICVFRIGTERGTG